MNDLPKPPAKSPERGRELTEAELEILLISSRRSGRRQKAARATLDLTGPTRLAAQSELRREAANAVQQSWPRDRYHLEQVLWLPLTKYSETLFDTIAEARLQSLGINYLVRRYTHWLRCYCIAGVIDEDVCSPMGQFYLTAEHIMKVIGEAQWPSRIGETRQALGWMLTEVIPGPHTANLAKRLRAHLEARVAHWESKAIETRSTPQPPQIQADTQVSEQYSSEAPTTKAIDAGQPASLEGTEDHATVGSPKLDSSRINKWIDDQGYDNETLAQQLKASRRATSSMRNNGKHHGRKLVTKLANLMDCDPEDLYRRSDGV